MEATTSNIIRVKITLAGRVLDRFAFGRDHKLVAELGVLNTAHRLAAQLTSFNPHTDKLVIEEN